MFTDSSPLGVIVARLRLSYGRTGEKHLLFLFSHRRGFLIRVLFKGVSSPVVHFLSMLRFESKGKLDDLGLDI